MKKVLLLVLDGYGVAPPGPGNAIYLANPAYINNLCQIFPHGLLQASGETVGLPKGDVGNTEVGHLNIGAGKIIYQDLPRINMSIADGSFYKIPALIKCIDHIKKSSGNLHLIGLISNGVVHSSVDHLLALLYLAHEQKVSQVFIHAITDGRDSPPKSSLDIIKKIEEKTSYLHTGQIASIMGRYYAMDRDRRWERTAKAYFCLTQGQGGRAISATEAIENSYKNNIADEFIIPTNIIAQGRPVALIKEGDGVIFFNYRIDRAKQLTKAFVLDDLEHEANKSTSFDLYGTKYTGSHLKKNGPSIPETVFSRGKKIDNLFFVTMTEYEAKLPVHVAFQAIRVRDTLGKVLEDNNLKQLHMAESEKERFVTYYFNGQRESPYKFEDRLIVPSPYVATYDLKPEMSAYELTKILIEKIKENKYAFILTNYANPDMVGHTGNIQATIMAIKAVDTCVKDAVEAALKNDYVVLITGDHGNAEQKIDTQTGEISTEHTSSSVPLIVCANDWRNKPIRLQTGILADIAPTVINILGLCKPDSMTGRNLVDELSSKKN